jgi:hypothetical protein
VFYTIVIDISKGRLSRRLTISYSSSLAPVIGGILLFPRTLLISGYCGQEICVSNNNIVEDKVMETIKIVAFPMSSWNSAAKLSIQIPLQNLLPRIYHVLKSGFLDKTYAQVWFSR